MELASVALALGRRKSFAVGAGVVCRMLGTELEEMGPGGEPGTVGLVKLGVETDGVDDQ
jgi:hypothetical protein